MARRSRAKVVIQERVVSSQPRTRGRRSQPPMAAAQEMQNLRAPRSSVRGIPSVSSRTRHSGPPLQGRRKTKMTALRQYQNSLSDPFQHIPPPISAGTIYPLQRKLGFVKGLIPIAASNTLPYWIIWSCGSRDQTNGGVYYAGTSSFTSFPPSYSAMVFANANQLTATVQTCRLISGGLSVTARVGALAVPCTFYAGSVYDTPANLSTSSFSGLINNVATRMITCSDALQGAYATFRPGDMSAFNLTSFLATQVTTNNHSIQYVLIQVPTGVALNLEINAAYHFESNSGVDTATGDEDDVASVNSLEGTVEQVGRVAATLSDASSGPVEEIVHSAIDTAILAASRGPRGLSLRSEGGLVGSSSSSSSSSDSVVVDQSMYPVGRPPATLPISGFRY